MPSTKGAQYHDKSQRQRRDMTPILGTLISNLIEDTIGRSLANRDIGR